MRDVRRVIIIALIAVLASCTLALATWKVVDLVQEEEQGTSAQEASSALEGAAAEDGGVPGEGALQEEAVEAAEVDAAPALREVLAWELAPSTVSEHQCLPISLHSYLHLCF